LGAFIIIIILILSITTFPPNFLDLQTHHIREMVQTVLKLDKSTSPIFSIHRHYHMI